MSRMSWKILIPVATAAATIAGAAVLHGAEPSPPAPAAPAPSLEVRSAVMVGEATRKTRGDLALYVPAELAVRDGAFDLVVHFHGVAKNQETNVDEAHLPAAIVSVNAGALSDAYGKAFAGEGALDRLVRFAEEEVSAKRSPGARAGRIALSSWSAGGAAVKNIIAREADRIDAVILSDGIFSYWEDTAKTTVKREPLDPFIDFAKRAVAGEKLFVITHTAIPTEYPNVEQCTGVLLEELDLPRGPALPATQPAGGAPTYSVDRGSFHVRAVDGKGPEEHIAQIRALDDAYSELRRRWEK